jgi:peptidoglycan-N-acetylglucosamine deacetylase
MTLSNRSTDALSFTWPDQRRCAISLTFDDGLVSQVQTAIPSMNDCDLRGTFYLNPRGYDRQTARLLNCPSTGWRDQLQIWLPMHLAGHEIGNHTVTHPCSLNIQAEWLEGKYLQDWSLAQIEADMLLAQERIQSVFPNQRATSFAYPCYESDVGHGAQRTSYTPVVARHFVAARARGEYANDPLFCDLHHLSSWPVERQDGSTMIGLVEQALAQGRWGVFTFHGINEGHLPVGLPDFLELLDHLVYRRVEVWVAPVAEVGEYITRMRRK